MPDKMAVFTSQIYIKIEGTAVQADVMQNLASVVVDQHAHLPDMFTIHLYDPDLNFIDYGPFNLTSVVEIGSFLGNGQPIMMMQGEVTALEPNFTAGGTAELIVRGYDRSHRLYRHKRSEAYLNVRDSDLAQKFAQAAGLQAKVEATKIIYEHLYQHNQSDLVFLQERAARIGYECFVLEKTLYFRQTDPKQEPALTLTWGENNLAVRPRMTLSEQVDEVLVQGWDSDLQRAIVGRANQGTLYPEIGESKNGTTWAKGFGRGNLVITDEVVQSQAEADELAKARMAELSGAFIEVEGTVFRRPDVKAGQVVLLDKLGNRFSGKYLITNATHVYTSKGGLETTFTVRGLRTGLISEQLGRGVPTAAGTGVVTAVVTNNQDPRQLGRVKVKFPWLTETAESGWTRLAGADRAAVSIPAVGDEVLVAFEHGDFNRPYVIGMMWNAKHNLPLPFPKPQEDRSQIRTWQSRAGHQLTMSDKLDQPGIALTSKNGHKVNINDQQNKMEITTSSGVSITLDDTSKQITIQSTGSIQLTTTGNMELKAGQTVSIQAGGQVNIKATAINLN